MIREFYKQRIQRGLVRRLNNLKIASVARHVANEEPQPNGAPVVFFKASTGIDDLSWNSGFHLLASWAFRLKGIPVAYFACHSGMSKCVLGTNRDNPYKEPPCKTCIAQSKTLYTNVNGMAESQRSGVNWFKFERNMEIESALQNLSVEELSRFEWELVKSVTASRSSAKQSPVDEEIASSQSSLLAMTLPLGALCLPGLRFMY